MIVRLIGWFVIALVPLTGCLHGNQADSAGSAAATGTGIVVNGGELSAAQLATLEKFPPVGRYWYDATSGLYGPSGSAPAGVMRARHEFGQLCENASAGTTLVVINGRRLTVEEADYLASLAHGRILPGRYWLDDRMNWGMEGNDFPVGNFRRAAAVRAGDDPPPDGGWAALLRGEGWESLPEPVPVASNK